MPERRSREHIRYRYGKCLNDKCSKNTNNEIIEVRAGKDFVCPDCGKPLRETRPPKKSNSLRYIYIIAGVIFIGLIIAGIIIFVPSKEDEIVEPVVNELPLDSIQPEEQVIPNRNDTLVIKVEGLENASDSMAQSADPVVEEVVQEESVKEPSQSSTITSVQAANTSTSSQTTSHKLSYGTWTGGWKNGQPHGTGTMTYSTSHTIDARDTKGRVAQPGEYIVGEWDNGHLVQGRWFKKDGTKEAVIIGKAG